MMMLYLSTLSVVVLMTAWSSRATPTCQHDLCHTCNTTSIGPCCDPTWDCVFDPVFDENICVRRALFSIHRRVGAIRTSRVRSLQLPPYHWICSPDDEPINMKGCGENGIVCDRVRANNLTFDCRFAGVNNSDKGDVLLLHGFPEFSDMFNDLMQRLDEEGYRSAACNQRGYSPGASPDEESAYDYDILAEDAWSVADEIGFSNKFHLVGHDHGAMLGWTMAGSDRGEERLKTFTALSVPHPDAFSAGLFGDGADVKQQIASQYFTMFTLPDSASIHFEFWYRTMGKSSGFPNATAFQKALWWYNGAMEAGIMAMPPLMSAWSLTEHGALATAGLRELFGGKPNDGYAATRATGDISVSSLYVCGSSDTAILCNRPYALRTKEYCPPSSYTYLEVDCGHDLLACSNASETNRVTESILTHLRGN